MAVISYTQKLLCSASAARVFKASCLDSHNLFPKLMPYAIKSIKFEKGDCVAPGNVKVLTFAGDGKNMSVKHRVDEVDVEKLYYKYTTIEGEILGEKFDSIVMEEKVDVQGAGSVVVLTTHFHPKGDYEFEEDKFNLGKEMFAATYKTLDQYLQANPQAYA